MSRYPGEVIIDGNDADGSATPAGDPDNDFFSSWDKPAIKKSTPPISRTATPVTGRTPSPFLNPNNVARSSSPLAKPDGEAKPAGSRITTSAALRKTTTAGGPRKTNVLGSKKPQKLGAKKVTADIIDFDEAEKKAKEEAERIAKLGYDPDAVEQTDKSAAGAATPLMAPTPVSPRAAPPSHTRQKSNAEMERLGMGVQRLGFGQIGGKRAAAPTRNAGGFGSVGPVKSAAVGKYPYVSLR